MCSKGSSHGVSWTLLRKDTFHQDTLLQVLWCPVLSLLPRTLGKVGRTKESASHPHQGQNTVTLRSNLLLLGPAGERPSPWPKAITFGAEFLPIANWHRQKRKSVKGPHATWCSSSHLYLPAKSPCPLYSVSQGRFCSRLVNGLTKGILHKYKVF